MTEQEEKHVAAQFCEIQHTIGGDPRFYAMLAEIAVLHARKQRDYGSDADPFANVRQSQEWDIPPWVGAMVRLNDKVRRLQQFAQRGELANESARDSMRDIAVYALIAAILYDEEAEEILSDGTSQEHGSGCI